MKGILMKPEMVVAIAERRKTNTRRLGGLKEINREPNRWLKAIPIPRERLLYTPFKGLWQFSDAHDNIKLAKPRYQVGETVYIKEVWANIESNDYLTPSEIVESSAIFYKVGGGKGGDDGDELNMERGKWRSPLFMPEWAARYFIVITDVRAERLQEITPHDCIMEGIIEEYGDGLILRDKFEALWNSINKDYPWESNPWVFPYTFRLKEAGER